MVYDTVDTMHAFITGGGSNGRIVLASRIAALRLITFCINKTCIIYFLQHSEY